MSTTEKVLFTGKTHITAGRNGSARSSDGQLDIKLPQPHPAAEHLFGAAWSACFIGAIQLAASQRKVALPATPSVDTEINLLHGETGFFLRALGIVFVAAVLAALAVRIWARTPNGAGQHRRRPSLRLRDAFGR